MTDPAPIPAIADHPLQGLYDFLLREYEAIPTSGEAVTVDIRPHFNALCEYMAADETKNPTPSSADVIEGMREALFEEHRLQIAEGLRLPPPDRERIAKALWESQRARIKNLDGINARLSWRDKSVPEMFWHHYELDGDAVIAALTLPDSKPDKGGA